MLNADRRSLLSVGKARELTGFEQQRGDLT